MGKVPGARVGVLHTVFGPLQEHEGRRMKFPAAVATKALAARSSGTLELWGDGSQLRSYLHVDDAVDRIITIATADRYDGPVNVGAAGPVTCREIAELCLDIVGADADIVTNPAEPTGCSLGTARTPATTPCTGPVHNGPTGQGSSRSSRGWTGCEGARRDPPGGR